MEASERRGSEGAALAPVTFILQIVEGDAVTLERWGHAGAAMMFVVSSLLVCGGCLAQSSSIGTTPFVLDGNRIYAELDFIRPDGSIHRALAFVDMGSPSMILAESLFKELQLDEKKPLHFRVGELSVEVPAAEVSSESTKPHSMGSDLLVEGMLPAGVLQRYQVVIDYQKRTLTLTRPGGIKPEGIPVPFHLKRETGLIAVDASINGKSYAVTIDNGSAYTWFRQNTVKAWLNTHAEWERGVGAVGASNMMMSGDGAEVSGILVRIPEIAVGQLTLKQVGALGAGPGRGFSTNLSLFDWYSTKNAVPVIGWIGGNVLKNFRLTIDYPNQTIYWLKRADPDTHDLDQVGLTLRAEQGEYFVAAIARKNGKPTVEGVSPGDKLIRIGDLEMKNATWGAIYNAMHGNPGETRELVLERNGERFTVSARVTAF